MITKEQAIELGERFGRVYGEYCRNKNGDYTDCKVNGRCKTWKTRPNEFRLPIKIGFREYGYITPVNCHEWSLEPIINETIENLTDRIMKGGS